MCGFAGILSTAGFTREELADHASRMIAPIAHRGPDDSGDLGGRAGGRRAGLSPARDPRPLAARPSADVVAVRPVRHRLQRRGLQLRDLRRELESHGYGFHGHSDTEVILAAFEQWGIDGGRPPFRGNVRDRGMGRASKRAVAGPGSARQEAALCLLRARPDHIRVGAQGAHRRPVVRPLDRSTRRSRPICRYLCVPAPKSILQAGDEGAARPHPDHFGSDRAAARFAAVLVAAAGRAETVWPGRSPARRPRRSTSSTRCWWMPSGAGCIRTFRSARSCPGALIPPPSWP